MELLRGKQAFSVQEVAAIFGISPITVYRLVQRGELKAVRFGRRVRIPRSEVERLLGMNAHTRPGVRG